MYCGEGRNRCAPTSVAHSARLVPYILFKRMQTDGAIMFVRTVREVRESAVLAENQHRMPGHTCIVCGSTPTKDPEASFHRLPICVEALRKTVEAFKTSLNMSEEAIRKVERDTKEQRDSTLWHEVRRYRVTASLFGDTSTLSCIKKAYTMPPKCTILYWFAASTADSRTSCTVRTSENCLNENRPFACV